MPPVYLRGSHGRSDSDLVLDVAGNAVGAAAAAARAGGAAGEQNVGGGNRRRCISDPGGVGGGTGAMTTTSTSATTAAMTATSSSSSSASSLPSPWCLSNTFCQPVSSSRRHLSSASASAAASAAASASSTSATVVPERHRYLTGTLYQRKSKNRYAYKKRYAVLDLWNGGSFAAYAIPPPPSSTRAAVLGLQAAAPTPTTPNPKSSSRRNSACSDIFPPTMTAAAAVAAAASAAAASRTTVRSLPAIDENSRSISGDDGDDGNGGGICGYDGDYGHGATLPRRRAGSVGRDEAKRRRQRRRGGGAALGSTDKDVRDDYSIASSLPSYRNYGYDDEDDDDDIGGGEISVAAPNRNRLQTGSSPFAETSSSSSAAAATATDAERAALSALADDAGSGSYMRACPLLGPPLSRHVPKLYLPPTCRWSVVDVRNHESLFVIEVPEDDLAIARHGNDSGLSRRGGNKDDNSDDDDDDNDDDDSVYDIDSDDDCNGDDDKSKKNTGGGKKVEEKRSALRRLLFMRERSSGASSSRSAASASVATKSAAAEEEEKEKGSRHSPRPNLRLDPNDNDDMDNNDEYKHDQVDDSTQRAGGAGGAANDRRPPLPLDIEAQQIRQRRRQRRRRRVEPTTKSARSCLSSEDDSFVEGVRCGTGPGGATGCSAVANDPERRAAAAANLEPIGPTTKMRRYYFKCPHRGNEKSLYLRAAAKIGRLDPHVRSKRSKRIKSAATSVASAVVLGGMRMRSRRTKASRVRTERRAELAERTLDMERALTLRPEEFALVTLLERTDDGGYVTKAERRASSLAFGGRARRAAAEEEAAAAAAAASASSSALANVGTPRVGPTTTTTTSTPLPPPPIASAELGPQSGRGHREFRVLPEYAYPHRWMTEEELTHEMLKPSTVFHDALDFGPGPSGGGANACPIIGSLQVEVLSCLGLPNLVMLSDPNPVVYLVCGSSAFVTDVIPTRNHPLWPRKARRACSFRLRHAYAQLCAGVFDASEEGRDDAFAGRAQLDVSRLRPGCVYDVTLPLRQSSYVYARRRRGAIRLRFKLEWFSDKAAVLSYLPWRGAFRDMMKRKRGEEGAPAVTIRCADAKAFRNVVLTVHGAHMPGRFSPKTFKSTVREFLLYRVMITLLIKKAVKDIVQWRSPPVSFLIFFGWMHCVRSNSMSLVPPYLFFFLLLFLARNYARYNVSERSHWGYAPLTFSEMLWGLLRASDAEWMNALEVEMRKRDENLSHGAAVLLRLLGFADDGGEGAAVAGGGAGRANIDHMEFPFSRGDTYPKMTVEESIARPKTKKKGRKGEGSLVASVPMMDLAATLYTRPGYDSADEEEEGSDVRYEIDEDDDEDWVVRELKRQNPSIIGSEVVIHGAGATMNVVNRGADFARGTVGRGAEVTIKTMNRGARTTLKTVDKGTRTTLRTVNRGARATLGVVDRGARATLKTVDRGARTTLKTAGLNDNVVMSTIAVPVGLVAAGISVPLGMTFGLVKSVFGAIAPASADSIAGVFDPRRSFLFTSAKFGSPSAKRNLPRSLEDDDEGARNVQSQAPAPPVPYSPLGLVANDLAADKPLPEQNMDVKVIDNKDIKAELLEIKGKIHQDTFRLFDDRLFLMSEASMPATVLSQVEGSAARAAAEERRQIELQKQIGLYSYNNPVMARAAVILGPILSMVHISLNAIRAIFNIFMWKDPYMSFWASLGCIVLIAVLIVFPWRVFLLLVGIAGVGPQNFFYRKWKEKYGYRLRARTETDDSLTEPRSSSANVKFRVGTIMEKKQRFAFWRGKRTEPALSRNNRKLSSGTSASKDSTATTANDDETLSSGGGFSKANQSDGQKPLQLFASHVSLVDGSYPAEENDQGCSDGYQEVVVPYTPLRQNRFYDWPPDPSVSRVTADPIQNEAFRQA